MKRTPITIDRDTIPSRFHPLLEAPIFDSSCSSQARVYFIDRDGGYYLKTARKGSLQKEAAMTGYFHSLGLGAEVLACESLEKDWLLTRRVPGEDCLDSQYLQDPKRLCDTLAEILRKLHDLQAKNCPINRTADYIDTAHRNFINSNYDTSLFPYNWGYSSAEEAWRVVEDNEKYLRCDTLLHGDYCMPNIILNNWQFSGFIDLDTAGMGDRHIDLFWGIWSLNFNLKTDAYRDRFLDAYGRADVEEEMLRVVAAFEVFG